MYKLNKNNLINGNDNEINDYLKYLNLYNSDNSKIVNNFTKYIQLKELQKLNHLENILKVFFYI